MYDNSININSISSMNSSMISSQRWSLQHARPSPFSGAFHAHTRNSRVHHRDCGGVLRRVGDEMYLRHLPLGILATIFFSKLLPKTVRRRFRKWWKLSSISFQ